MDLLKLEERIRDARSYDATTLTVSMKDLEVLIQHSRQHVNMGAMLCEACTLLNSYCNRMENVITAPLARWWREHQGMQTYTEDLARVRKSGIDKLNYEERAALGLCHEPIRQGDARA